MRRPTELLFDRNNIWKPVAALAAGSVAVMLAGCGDREITAIPKGEGTSITVTETESPTETQTAAPTTTETTSPAGTMPTEDFSPQPGASETETNQEISNAIDRRELTEKYRGLSVADVEQLVKNNDYEAMATYRALLDLEHLSNLGDLKHTGEGSDCLLGETSNESPVRSSAVDAKDGRAAWCMVYGQEGVVSTQTDAPGGYAPSGTELSKEEAQKAAILMFGPATSDPRYQEDLQRVFDDIEITDVVYGINYGDSATSAEIIETGEMQLGDKTVTWKRIKFEDGNSGTRIIKVAYYPLDNPILPLDATPEDGKYPGNFDPETGLIFEEEGNMQYEMNDDGTATPVVSVVYGTTDPELTGKKTQITMPFLVDDRPTVK